MSEPNTHADFTDRFEALMEEAKSYGLATLVVVNDFDPLSDHDTTEVLYKGGYCAALGMAQLAKAKLLANENDD